MVTPDPPFSGVPCSAINALDSVVTQTQAVQRKMIVSAYHETMGQLEMVGSAIKFSAFPECGIRNPAPSLDQHRQKILENL